ncbi:MAG TPA: hypothetical protein VKH42_13505, partial [Vicinamibacterales bacterium]|nr:hypothetical protein [Vicinamibacterales bacterium]
MYSVVGGLDLAIELAFGETDADTLAARRPGRVAQHARAVRIPADGVTAAEYCKRTERVEASGGLAETGGGTITAAPDGGGESSVGGNQTHANRREPPAGVESGELTFELRPPAFVRGEPPANQPRQIVAQ